ncbi:PQQ-dependent sugar dehydrogenase [Vibrio aquaticus]|uniref:PQQ-dependent sugar dehydrogenase n=1 Tax=Vibrio aquaticus TaxID=2496559 RepID=A0A3S0MJA9_9VIBR|nr:PQQ-dependent sugar dehydrogenase [Vibrio aquaticus]RTZ15561.1 PQQ-dependent sugar dehydrogenase [Vibrio aquaticus]
MSMKNPLKALLLSLALPFPAVAASWSAEPIVEGLNIPWGLSYVGDNAVVVSEKNGTVGLLNLSNQQYSVIGAHPSVAVYGQGGLLDVAQSPFDEKTVYFTYAKAVGNTIETTLSQASYSEGKLSDWQDVLVTHSGSDGGRHFGSRITFDDEGIYFSVGDRGERDNGQNTETHAGSILKILSTGEPTPENPFLSQKTAKPEIWSYGHRNPQGLFYDSQEKQLWSIEHGPRGGDEINLIMKGANYGWPVTSHGKEYWGPISVGEAEEKEGIISPLKVYVPSIAPGSLLLYRGSTYPELNGKLLAGALKLAHINVLTIVDGAITQEQRILEDLGERIRDIEALPSGDIIFSTDSGKIYRLVRQD